MEVQFLRVNRVKVLMVNNCNICAPIGHLVHRPDSEEMKTVASADVPPYPVDRGSHL